MSNLNTSEITSTKGMFYNCQTLSYIDLSNLNMSNVEDMSDMFRIKPTDKGYYFSLLTDLDFTGFDTQKVKNMSHLFDGCVRLNTINSIESINTANVQDMSYMFASCSSLNSLDVSNLLIVIGFNLLH